MFGKPHLQLGEARISMWYGSLGLVLGLWACGPAPVPRGDATEATPDEPMPVSEGPGRSYERMLVFLSDDTDEPMLLPWRFVARTRPGGVDRSVNATLLSGGTWEGFFSSAWSGPPSRAPWRLLPHEGMSLIVGANDRVDNVIFREPPNELDLDVGPETVDWSGPRGEDLRVNRATLLVANVPTPGSVVDVSRNWRPADRAPGDWIVLVSGDSVQLLLEGETEGGETPYRGWGRADERELQWPSLSVVWDEVRAYEPARRDVPDTWSVVSDNGELVGAVSVESSQLWTGEGPGPQLPVEALFLVRGTMTLLGAEYSVWGLVQHTQTSP